MFKNEQRPPQGLDRSCSPSLGRRGLVFFFLLILIVTLGLCLPPNVSNILYPAKLGELAKVGLQAANNQGLSSQALMIEGMPFLGAVNEDIVKTVRERLLTLSFYTLTRVDITDPKTFFFGQLPVEAMELTSTYNPKDPEDEGPILELIPQAPQTGIGDSAPQTPVPKGTALVGMYSTHNSESYQGDGGSLYKWGNGDIMQVMDQLTSSLEKLGVPVDLDKTVHDVPSRDHAYEKSIITATKIVKDNPQLKVLLDVHRDGVPDETKKKVVMINGQPASPVMIVIGQKHPNWQQNDAFARELVAKGNQLYPGLFLPVYYASDARYNQHLHPHAILLEFGDQHNTIEEADRSAQAVAQVLAQMIKG